MELNKDRRKTENLKEREIMMFQLKEFADIFLTAL